VFPENGDVMGMVREVRQRMAAFATSLRDGRIKGATGKPIRDVVNLGVGGSDLGPRMAVRALRLQCKGGVRAHFASNADHADLDAVLAGLDPAETLFIIASKTFTTVETMSNARRARAWLSRKLGTQGQALSTHFAAATAAPAKAGEFGVPEEHIFPMWDWVGGRYSLWSAVGLPIAIAAGPAVFEELLAGGLDMDEHFRSAPLEANMPVIMALLSVWYSAFFGAQTHAVLPYCEDLRELPNYLQQLQMESNGKRVDREGRAIDYPSSAVLWGGAGTVSQHSFHQLLHQGTHLIPVDFIVPVRAGATGEGRDGERKDGEDDAAQRMLVANALAQGAALLEGSEGVDGHRHFPGNRPSSTLMLKQLTPRTLGALIALYEHKVFVEASVLGINPFDQWGVELGKVLAHAIENGKGQSLDASTLALMTRSDSLRKG
jgi:glucose-6-phosphate isomerase